MSSSFNCESSGDLPNNGSQKLIQLSGVKSIIFVLGILFIPLEGTQQISHLSKHLFQRPK